MLNRCGTFLFVLVTVAIASPSTTWADTCHVNSADGSDLAGTGSSSHPFETITYALTQCDRPGDNIHVEVADPYDTANGEVFPLQVSRGVTLQGVPVRTLWGVIRPLIRGGGHFELPDSRGRYVAVVGADEATISGFRFDVVDDPEFENTGTGIMCDSGSPTVEGNTLGGDAHAGVATLGESHPIIRNNRFGGNRSGNLTWGVTVYGDSEPHIESNTFTTRNGVDSTDRARPTIDSNTISTSGVGVSAKGWSTSTIVNNVIRGNELFGILLRMDSTAMIQSNQIMDSPVGVHIAPGPSCPTVDLGGGGRSDGGNTLRNDEWDLENRCRDPVMARNNSWSHSPCCEWIDSEDLFDDDEAPAAGAVDVGLCLLCRALLGSWL